MCTSDSTSAKRPLRHCARPCSPSFADSQAYPARASWRATTTRLVGWSSTIRIRLRSASACGISGSGRGMNAPNCPGWAISGSISSTLPRGRVMARRSVVPAPGVLSIDTSPPMASARRRLITRPSPLPPKRRVVLPSAWLKGWNRRACWSGVTPMPVSVTRNTRRSRSPSRPCHSSATSMKPASVNLIAFDRKFDRICRRRRPSTTCAGPMRSSTVTVSTRPLLEAEPVKLAAVDCSRRASDIVVGASSMRPASTLEKSRMSPMICSRDAADCWITWIVRRWSVSSSLCASTSSMPVTPIIGVRISWLIAARKLLLAILASRAATSLERSFFSSCLMSVRSVATPR